MEPINVGESLNLKEKPSKFYVLLYNVVWRIIPF